MATDETITLCANLVGEAIQRDRPDLAPGAKFCALVRGVAAALEAGAFACDGALYFPNDRTLN